ncbi:MAG: hypothetical protein H7Z14_17400, partial [Anaerolineae bacterium]|nr:hypothetical protein [Phycisphaerae bacterium]
MSNAARTSATRINTARIKAALGTACLSALLATAGGCGSDEPFDPRAAQRSEREAAREAKPYPMRPLPTTLESSYLPTRPGEQPRPARPATAATSGPSLAEQPRVRMNLRDMIHRAVINNLDVKVAGYGPGIEASRTVEAEARFDPTIFANAN